MGLYDTYRPVKRHIALYDVLSRASPTSQIIRLLNCEVSYMALLAYLTLPHSLRGH